MGLISRVSSRTYRYSFPSCSNPNTNKLCLDLAHDPDPRATDRATLDPHLPDESDPGPARRAPIKSCTPWLFLTCRVMSVSLNSSENSKSTAKSETFSCQETDTPVETEALLLCDSSTSETKRTVSRASSETQSTLADRTAA